MVIADAGVLGNRDGDPRTRRPRVQIIPPIQLDANAMDEGIAFNELVHNLNTDVQRLANQHPAVEPQQNAVPRRVDDIVGSIQATTRPLHRLLQLLHAAGNTPDVELRLRELLSSNREVVSLFIGNRRRRAIARQIHRQTRRNDIPAVLLEPTHASPQPGPQNPGQSRLNA